MTNVTEETLTILEIVDIEEYMRDGRPVPAAHRYRYRVNTQHFISEKPEISGRQILERAGLVPVDHYRLRLKRRHGPPEEIKHDEIVHLRDHGIERFIAQPKEVQDGREARHDFVPSAQDKAFLDGLGLQWEALNVANRLWVVIYGLALPAGYQVGTADVAIEIAPGYPTSQLDMAYFNPPLRRTDGRPIANADVIEQLDGKGWQRWSRHRIGRAVWVPATDNLESHFCYMQDWLAREVAR